MALKWNVSNAISRDVERQQLNRILADIRAAIDTRSASVENGDSIQDTVGGMVENNNEKGITVTYDATTQLLDFAVSDFIIRLSGDISGEGEVVGLNTVTIDTTIDPDLLGVPEAPIDNNFYWRWNGEWAQVGNAITSFSAVRGTGFAAGSQNTDGDERWVLRQLEVTTGELTLANADGETDNPLFGLADVTDSGVGDSPLKLLTIDAKGRVSGTESATTTDLPEGSNLYFTDERAQDAVGTVLADSADIDFTYTDATPSISAVLTTAVHASLTLADSSTQPGDNVSDLANDAGYLTAAVLSVVAGTNVTVDNTDPANPIVNATGGGGAVDSVNGQTGVVVLDASDVGAVDTSLIGAADGVAPLASDGKIDASYLPASVLGQVEYQGSWDASAGTAPSASPEKGWYYIVTVAGTTSLDGITDWQVGDWAIYNGTAWNKVDNTDAVSSVAGLTGVISSSSLKTALSLNNVDNTSDVNKPVSTAQATADTASKARANHTGTQLASTISDFATTVRATVLTGLSTATSTVAAATDTILVAIGKLQAQVSLRALSSRTISTTAPLAGGGDLSADRTLTISAATTSAAGSLSAADKTKLDALPTLDAGTYTPTLTNIVNVSSSTVGSALQYSRVGSVVTVSGRINVTPSAGGSTLTRVGITLPVASTFSASGNVGGAGAAGQTPFSPALIVGDTTNNRAEFQFYSGGTGNVACFFTFTYVII